MKILPVNDKFLPVYSQLTDNCHLFINPETNQQQMEYYVIQVLTGKEELFLKLAEKHFFRENINFFWLRKELIVKKHGIRKKSVSSIFPGYIFAETEVINYDNYKKIKSLPGFIRFLENNLDIRPLPVEDKKLVFKLHSGGEIAGISRVFFTADDKIKVSDGPMKGLEGYIIKVDKRKKRAKIKLKLYEDSFMIDFGFELLEHNPDTSEKNK